MVDIPRFERRQGRRGREMYLPQEGWSFPPAEWAPVLNTITDSSTVGEQRKALTMATMCVAAYKELLWPRGEERAVTRLGYDYSGIRVRINPEDGEARLVFVRTQAGSIAYQSPDSGTPNPAFAVHEWSVDGRTGAREVYATPDRQLGNVASALGRAIKFELAEELHHQYPGFGILDAVGVSYTQKLLNR